jgi:hypothetical protein
MFDFFSTDMPTLSELGLTKSNDSSRIKRLIPIDEKNNNDAQKMYHLEKWILGEYKPKSISKFEKFEDAQEELITLLKNKCEELGVFEDSNHEELSWSQSEIFWYLENSINKKEFDYWAYDNFYYKIINTLNN